MRQEPRAARRFRQVRLVPHDLACESPGGGAGGADRPDRWLAVWSIALGSLALVFSEVVPIGLLPDISHHLGISIGTAGLMVVVPAVTAAIAAPSLTVGSAWFERRRLLLGLSILVLVSDAVAATAPSFVVLLGARVLLGACIGGFWAFGTGAAMSLVRADFAALRLRSEWWNLRRHGCRAPGGFPDRQRHQLARGLRRRRRARGIRDRVSVRHYPALEGETQFGHGLCSRFSASGRQQPV